MTDAERETWRRRARFVELLIKLGERLERDPVLRERLRRVVSRVPVAGPLLADALKPKLPPAPGGEG